MRKTFLLMMVLAIAAMAMPARALNIFRDGSTWKVNFIGHAPDISSSTGLYYIDGTEQIDGMECLRLMGPNGTDEGVLQTYLRTEGEKVWFMSNPETKEWVLLYDFGLQPGESCEVGIISYPFSTTSPVGLYTVTCESIEADTANPGVEKMNIKVSTIPENPISDQQGVWLKGVGSTTGVLMNVYFDMVGLSTTLMEATCDGQIVYSNPAATANNWFNPENTWEYVEVSCYDYDIAPFYNLNPFLMKCSGTETQDGKEYLRFDWNWKTENPSRPMDSHYLLREENGAYYIYVGDENEESHSGLEVIEPGEYLLYDFNMEEGDEYEAPCALELNFEEGLAVQAKECFMARFKVSKKSVDEQGRRVLELEPIESIVNDYHYYCEPQTIVEGVGPITRQSNLAIFYSPPMPTGAYTYMFEFYGVFSPEGDEVYLTPEERGAGFWKEKDYTWVYGIYDNDGNVSYMKMGFNYYNEGYRRFIIMKLSDSLDGEWHWAEFEEQHSYLVREEDGKVYGYRDNLIYDFNAADNSMLRIDTTEGFQDFTIRTSFTEVGGEETRSYTFDDSNGVKCVEGIGVIQGGILPCVNGRFKLPLNKKDDSYCGAVLLAVYDGEDNLIFSQEMPSGIGEIIPDSTGWVAPADRLYDLQGRELSEPQPGQPYIRAGKIHIAK